MLRAAWTIDGGSSAAVESASAKLLAARAGSRAAHSALALVGNTGYTDELRQCYLDASALETSNEPSAKHVHTIASAMLEES